MEVAARGQRLGDLVGAGTPGALRRQDGGQHAASVLLGTGDADLGGLAAAAPSPASNRELPSRLPRACAALVRAEIISV